MPLWYTQYVPEGLDPLVPEVLEADEVLEDEDEEVEELVEVLEEVVLPALEEVDPEVEPLGGTNPTLSAYHTLLFNPVSSCMQNL